MLEPTEYGFAHQDDVDDAITVRLSAVDATNAEHLAKLLGEAIAALSDINQSVPVETHERHLIAGALEAFANGE